MKPAWYDYEAEEYDLDNAYNEDDDRRTDPRVEVTGNSYGGWGTETTDSSVWYG